MRLSPLVLLAVLAAAGGLLAPPASRAGTLAAPGWDDGNAEVALYSARGERYGIERGYEVVLILVKEPFDVGRGVKAEPAAPEDVPAMKLNTVVTMRTGVYAYRQMVSSFLRRSDMAPLKVAFSSQEWCGTTFKQWRDRGPASRLETRSYLEGEGDRDWALPAEPGLVFADALPAVVRDDPDARAVRLVESLVSNRAPGPVVEDGRIEPGGLETVALPDGARRARRVDVRRGERVDRLWLDVEPPHHVLRWEQAGGHVLELRRVERIPYWKLNHPGDEARFPGLEGAVP